MKTIIRTTIVLFGISFILGCMYGAVRVTKLNSIKPGMNKKEVISLLKPPISTCRINDVEYSIHNVWETISDTTKGRTTTCFVKTRNGSVEEWGRNDISIEQIEKEGKKMFDEANIKKIEIRFIELQDRTRWYKVTNKSVRDGGQLFKREVDNIIDKIQKRGYIVEIGESINITFPPDSPLGWGQFGKYRYYLAVQPFLKSLQKQDIDAVILFTIPTIRYRYVSKDGYTSPYDIQIYNTPVYSSPFNFTETNDLTFLEVLYYVFDLKSKKLLYLDSISGIRNNNYLEHSAKVSKNLPPGGRAVFFWNFTEGENEFLQRIFNIYLPKYR
jgi:hypothetical protein